MAQAYWSYAAACSRNAPARFLQWFQYVVIEEWVRYLDQALRATRHRDTSIEAIFCRSRGGDFGAVEIDIACDVKVKPAVAIKVTPGAAGAPVAAFESSVARDVGERSITVVMEECIGAEVGYENIRTRQ
ncbi:MAG: hypothetical protein ABSE93_19410 [Terriglobia bacterium]